MVLTMLLAIGWALVALILIFSCDFWITIWRLKKEADDHVAAWRDRNEDRLVPGFRTQFNYTRLMHLFPGELTLCARIEVEAENR